jgi:hypothetical protein
MIGQALQHIANITDHSPRRRRDGQPLTIAVEHL